MENMEEIVISTTKLGDIVPLIVVAFLLSICALICCIIWFYIEKANEKTIEDLEGRIEDIEGQIEDLYHKIYACASDTRLEILEKKVCKLQHLCAYEKKKNE